MARVEIDQIVLDNAGTPITGASVQVNVRGGGAATVYAAETGGSTVPNPLTTINGRIEAWLEPGSYDLSVTHGVSNYVARFEAFSGSGSSTILDWAPSTPIRANEVRRAPDGTLQRAPAAFTTSAAYDATKWTPAVADVPSALIDPRRIPNLLAWYNADTLGLADGATVQTWPDLSGHGFDLGAPLAANSFATQAPPLTRPAFKAAQQNGKGCVRFNGVSDCLNYYAPQGFLRPPWTVFLVVRVPPTLKSLPNASVGYGGAIANFEDKMTIARTLHSNLPGYAAYYNKGTAGTLGELYDKATPPDGQFQIVTAIWDNGTPTPPAVPASGVAQTNSFFMPMTVYVTGGTVTAIAVNGVTTGLTSGAIRVSAGGTITVTYSVAPTWAWVSDSPESVVLRVNGQQIQVQDCNPHSLRFINLGCVAGGTGANWAGFCPANTDIAEMIVVSRHCDAGEVRAIEQYLGAA